MVLPNTPLARSLSTKAATTATWRMERVSPVGPGKERSSGLLCLEDAPGFAVLDTGAGFSVSTVTLSSARSGAMHSSHAVSVAFVTE